MSVSGPSMSGKGIFIQNIIMRPELYHDEKGDPVWDEIHYWTGSAKLDVNLERLKNWTEEVLKQDPEKIILFMMDLIKKRYEMLYKDSAGLYEKQGEKASEYHRCFL